jgi:hypothetical protein
LYCSFYDLSDKKSADSFPFHLEGHAKIWYDTIPDSQKANFDNLITLFKNRFKDKQLTVSEEITFSARVTQCLNSSIFVGSFVITMVFNSDFNP